MFIFGTCSRSLAVVTSVKYGCDLKNLTCTFARSKILLTDKLTNGALVTSTPVLHQVCVLETPKLSHELCYIIRVYDIRCDEMCEWYYIKINISDIFRIQWESVYYASRSGICFNLNMSSYQIANSHYKNGTISRLYYLHNGKPFTKEDGVNIETGAVFRYVQTILPHPWPALLLHPKFRFHPYIRRIHPNS